MERILASLFWGSMDKGLPGKLPVIAVAKEHTNLACVSDKIQMPDD